jgi:multiple sugar transport system ATP-binding protein
MAEIKLTGVNKVYPGGTHAVHDVDLHIRDGEFMIMVGPSGCAKSTILRMIAGLEEISSGTIEIGGRVVNDVAPKDRDIAMVFQSYALYPHMTVRDNMSFGLRLRKMPEAEIQQRVMEAARILGLEPLLDRLPKAMSGGQRQRVAMGRAIVREPQAFLMDEPLSNLDAKLRVQMRTEIAKLHARLQTTTVYVTHDQVEAMTLGQRICILRKGVVQQVDTPFQVYTNPNNIFVGGFIGSPGMNFLMGHLLLHDGQVFLQLGEHHLALPPVVTSRLLSSTDINGRGVIVGIRPEHLDQASGDGRGGHALPVDVEHVETMGSEAYAYFTMNVPSPDLAMLSDTQAVASTFVARLDPQVHVRAGEPLWLQMDLDHLHLFDPETQHTLLAPMDEQEQRARALPLSVTTPRTEEPAAFAPRSVLHGYLPAGTHGFDGAGQQQQQLQPVINLHQTFAVPHGAPAASASPLTSVVAHGDAGTHIEHVFDVPVGMSAPAEPAAPQDHAPQTHAPLAPPRWPAHDAAASAPVDPRSGAVDGGARGPAEAGPSPFSRPSFARPGERSGTRAPSFRSVVGAQRAAAAAPPSTPQVARVAARPAGSALPALGADRTSLPKLFQSGPLFSRGNQAAVRADSDS